MSNVEVIQLVTGIGQIIAVAIIPIMSGLSALNIKIEKLKKMRK